MNTTLRRCPIQQATSMQHEVLQQQIANGAVW